MPHASVGMEPTGAVSMGKWQVGRGAQGCCCAQDCRGVSQEEQRMRGGGGGDRGSGEG